MNDIEENESTYDEETSSEEVEEDSEVDTSESESYDGPDDDDDEPEENCWSVLIKETMDRHEIELKSLENQYMEKGETKASAEVLAYNKMIPAFQNELRNVLLEKLVWIRALRRDPYYCKIMRTRRDLLDTGDYDWMEATQVAIDQRKFLLNNLFTTKQKTWNNNL
ncbi:protein SDA1 homolog [Actinia tenebrosa]|uniref:Protein SDA1 homolog n=1 Tax=Actinia tenebrosa TaxID=6105 RepID=A0A6P8ITT9_ACTTE|nr:protein SDA1 homolog [Actinia tenebrosa]